MQPRKKGDQRGVGLVLEAPVHRSQVGGQGLLHGGAPFLQAPLVLCPQRAPHLADDHRMQGQPVVCATELHAGIHRAKRARLAEAAPERCPGQLHPVRHGAQAVRWPFRPAEDFTEGAVRRLDACHGADQRAPVSLRCFGHRRTSRSSRFAAVLRGRCSGPSGRAAAAGKGSWATSRQERQRGFPPLPWSRWSCSRGRS